MMKNVIRKTIAVFLVPALLAGPGWANPFSASLSSGSRISVSSRYGHITDSFTPNASSAQPLMVLIQDLHANVGVQKNITHLILDLTKKMAHPLVMSEGGIGRGDISVFKNRPVGVIDSLLQNASLDGVELAAIQASHWIQIEGLEDSIPYLENVKAYRQSHALRPEALAELWALRGWTEAGSSPEFKTHLFRLQKLLTLKLTRSEWAAYLKNRSLNPRGSVILAQAIAASEQFYKDAMVRDAILTRHAVEGMSGQTFGIAVTGGFHTEGITQRLKTASIPYVVVTPNVAQLDNESVYERSLTEYLKGSAASSRGWNAANIRNLPAPLISLGRYALSRVLSPIHKIQSSRPKVRLIRAPWYRSLPARLAAAAFILGGGYWLMRAGDIGKPEFLMSALSSSLLATVSADESGIEFTDKDRYQIPVGQPWEQKLYVTPGVTPKLYRVEVFQNEQGQKAYVVRVNGQPVLAMRNNPSAGVYQTFPITDVTNERQAQAHLEALYNFFSLFKKNEGKDIQAEDDVVKNHVPPSWKEPAASEAEPLLEEKRLLGIVDSLDIYRLLARGRGTFIPSRPAYAAPKTAASMKIALSVNPNVTNAEAAIVRQLMGNPDVSIAAVIGMTPVQFWRTMDSSSLRRFLSPDVFSYDQVKGVIRLYGREVPVVKSLENIPEEERYRLGIQTIVSTTKVSESEATQWKKDLTVSDKFSDSVQTPSLKIVSMQPVLNQPVSEDLFANGVAPSDGVTERANSNGTFQLANSAIRIPALFAKLVREKMPELHDAVNGVHMTIMLPPNANHAILDQSGRQMSALANVLPGDGGEYRKQMLQAVDGQYIPDEKLRGTVVRYPPIQAGAEVVMSLSIPISDLTAALGIAHKRFVSPPGAPPVNVSAVLREALVKGIGNGHGLLEGQDLFVAVNSEMGNSHARGASQVILGLKQMELSVRGNVDSGEVDITIPLYFDPSVQDAAHLVGVLETLGQAGTAHLKPTKVARDMHVSDYQAAKDLSDLKTRQSFAPVALDLPDYIHLTPVPMRTGLVGPSGRIGSLLERDNYSLNIQFSAFVGGENASSIKDIVHAFHVDSTAGSWKSNGQMVQIDYGVDPQADPKLELGWIRLNGGTKIPVMKRQTKPEGYNWGAYKTQIVVDASTSGSDPFAIQGHAAAGRAGDPSGAEFGLVRTNPFKTESGADKTAFITIVPAVNSHLLPAYVERMLAEHKPLLISNASCTTNGVATLVLAYVRILAAMPILLERLGVPKERAAAIIVKQISAFMQGTHAVTNTQTSADSFEKAPIEARMASAINNIIQTSTGLNTAFKELGVFKEIAEVILASVNRVPVDTVSQAPLQTTIALDGLLGEDIAKLTGMKSKDLQKIVKRFVAEQFEAIARDPEFKELVEHVKEGEGTSSSRLVGSRTAVILDSQDVLFGLKEHNGSLMMNLGIYGWYENETGYVRQDLHLLDSLAHMLPLEGQTQAHSLYIPSFMEVFGGLHASLFSGNRFFRILSFLPAVFAYLMVLPRYVMVNAYGRGNYWLKLAVAWKAFTQGHLFGYHHADGRVELAEGLSPSLNNWAMRYLQTHELQPNERLGLFGKPVLFGTHPVYSFAAIISAFPVWLATRHQAEINPDSMLLPSMAA